ncbi:N-acyl-D-amino-acid deacylase family protein [Prauserella cavernicola]|uniref:D-aminoacylase n=1 Tax=Prauserella cavernicola TaxID=2800127 RepID=A0A934QZ51_9PSEU|nr:D-aminoacylase [Prauserella cavernicola]MBK1787964.1 D-aminoacylase [Prauserella cavernicola]
MPEFDVLLSGGTVVDGTGSAPVQADVGVTGDRVTFIGAAGSARSAAAVLDCTGAVVSPGFIDLHSHSDFTLCDSPAAQACVCQGVTTVVTGNCGSAPFPGPHGFDGVASTQLARNGGKAEIWPDFDGFAAAVEAARPAVNVAAMAGHATLRMAVLGDELRDATPDELVRMCGLLDLAAGQGIFGVSTGLIYAPGSFATVEELVAITEVAARHDLLYSTHMRDEGDHLLESVAEAVQTARRTGARLQISHLKALGPANHGAVEDALTAIDEARAEGLDVACDVYPYAASSTRLTSRLPNWALDGGFGALLERLGDRDARAVIAAELRERVGRTFLPAGITLAAMPEGTYTRWIGSSLADVAVATGVEPAQLALDVLAEHEAQVWIVNHAMAESDVDTVLRHPSSAVVSDGWVLDAEAGGHPHPRHFGTFARTLGRYVRDRGVLDLSEAVRKMTSLPAHRIGLTERGRLRRGLVADIAVFDAETVTDTATYEAPRSYALGVRHVLVNGRSVLRDGTPTAERAGRVLRRQDSPLGTRRGTGEV